MNNIFKGMNVGTGRFEELIKNISFDELAKDNCTLIVSDELTRSDIRDVFKLNGVKNLEYILTFSNVIDVNHIDYIVEEYTHTDYKVTKVLVHTLKPISDKQTENINDLGAVVVNYYQSERECIYNNSNQLYDIRGYMNKGALLKGAIKAIYGDMTQINMFGLSVQYSVGLK